jgi:hypothetical protein
MIDYKYWHNVIRDTDCFVPRNDGNYLLQKYAPN